MKNLNSDLSLTGSTLFLGEGNFLRDLSEEDESLISGGRRSRSRSRRSRRSRPGGKRSRRSRS